MKLPVKLLMSLISLVSVIARAGEYKNYSRDEIKYWRYTSYKGGETSGCSGQVILATVLQ
ncbi:hypothetical protein HXT13_23005 [Escherichia coli]|nr:hypothetical protein [Escherichia coli]